jgi:hypothetical protein
MADVEVGAIVRARMRDGEILIGEVREHHPRDFECRNGGDCYGRTGEGLPDTKKYTVPH